MPPTRIIWMVTADRHRLNMKYLIIILGAAIAAAFLILSSASHRPVTSDAKSEALKRIDQENNVGFESFFMPIIGRRLKKVGVGELKSEAIPEGSREVRLWVGFSLNGFSGLLI